MVNFKRRQWSVLLIDLAGSAACGALLVSFLWLTLYRGDRAGDEIRESSGRIAAAKRDLAGLHAALGEQNALIEQRKTELAAKGQLPDRTPMESYFRTLSQIAEQHHLHVVRQNPLSARSYPGLLEERYAYEVSGAMPDMVRFFHAIEETKFWADISYLKIADGSRQPGGSTGARLALLTISVFSSLRGETPDRG